MPTFFQKQGSLSSRLGAGFGAGLGQGFAEQFPRELERTRLSQGLQNFAQQSQQMTPLEQLAYISSVPGVTPQMIQSFGELAKQQAQAGAFNKGIPPKGPATQPPGGQPSPTAGPEAATEKFPFPKGFPQPQPGEKPPTVTTQAGTKATIEHYIPPTYDEIVARAGQMYESNPALYKNDPNLAMDAAFKEAQLESQRTSALQAQRKGQQDVLNTVRNEITRSQEKYNAKIPAQVSQEIEDEAIRKVNNNEMTEDQAGRWAGKQMDTIARDYEGIHALGGWGVMAATPSETKRNITSLRSKFKDRNDLENFADSLKTDLNISDTKAYYLAYPPSEYKNVNNYLAKLPPLEAKRIPFSGALEEPDRIAETEKIAPSLAKAMGEDASPLAIGEELKAKGYDPSTWLRYLERNRKKLKLGDRQGRELDKRLNFVSTGNDIWLFSWSGLDKLVEQE